MVLAPKIAWANIVDTDAGLGVLKGEAPARAPTRYERDHNPQKNRPLDPE